MKFKPGELVYDHRIGMTGMVMGIEEKLVGSINSNEMETELWYNVMLFGDHWCKDGKPRDSAIIHGDNILEAYNPAKHNQANKPEATHSADELSKVFLVNRD